MTTEQISKEIYDAIMSSKDTVISSLDKEVTVVHDGMCTFEVDVWELMSGHNCKYQVIIVKTLDQMDE